MAMPRPKGKALKIAKATVPGMAAEVGSDTKGKRARLPYRVGVEEATIIINENGGKIPRSER